MLDLSGLNIGVDGTYVIANALMYKNSVRALDLSLNNIGDDGAQAMAETMRMNTVLEVRFDTLRLAHMLDSLLRISKTGR